MGHRTHETHEAVFITFVDLEDSYGRISGLTPGRIGCEVTIH